MNAVMRSNIPAQIRQCCSQPTKEIVSSKFNKLKETQKRFQVDDGVPIFLKAGIKDKILYQASLISLGIGFVMSIQVFMKLAFPKK